MKKNVLLAMLIMGLVALLAVPFSLRPKQSRVDADRDLVVITPHWEGIRDEFDQAFREHWKAKTGEVVKIRWLAIGGGTDCLKFVLGQFKNQPDGIGVDMFWGGGVDPFELMRQAGHLAPFKIGDESLKRIPPTLFGYFLYSPDYTWYGSAISGFGIVFNRKVLNILQLPEPTTWEDLARPELFTYVGSGDPANSSTSHVMYEFILQGYGFEKGMQVATGISANARRFDKHSSQVSREVAIGEIAYGLSIDFYAGAAIAEAGADKLGFVYPNRLTIVNPDPISILKGAPNRDLAEAFLSFVLSEEGQQIWFLPKGSKGGPKHHNLMRVPVFPDLLETYQGETSLSYNPFKIQGTLEYRQNYGSSRWTILNDFLRASLIDTHDELVQAWKLIRDLPKNEREKWLARLAKPIITEDEMFRLAKEKWQDSTYRNHERTKWTIDYRKRYEAITRELRQKGKVQ